MIHSLPQSSSASTWPLGAILDPTMQKERADLGGLTQFLLCLSSGHPGSHSMGDRSSPACIGGSMCREQGRAEKVGFQCEGVTELFLSLCLAVPSTARDHHNVPMVTFSLQHFMLS
jgi:hypothetical protein